MRIFAVPLFSLFVALSISGCVTTSPDGVRQVRHEVTAKSGRRERVGNAWRINPDCSVTRVPHVRVTQPPTHGRLALVPARAPVTGAKRLVKCNSVEVPMIGYYYQSNPTYVGEDRFTVRVSSGSGAVNDSITNIQVRK